MLVAFFTGTVKEFLKWLASWREEMERGRCGWLQ